PKRPSTREGLQAFFARSSHDLQETLAAATPDTPAWTWAEEQTVGFIRRRQAHEALIHRVDAELAADNRTAMDPQLSADGVDEALRIMYGGVPDWGRFTPDATKTLRMLATDTGDSWFVTLGRFTGADPSNDKAHDEPDLSAADVDPGDHAAVTVSASAADLDCWLWHRATSGPIERSGDQMVLDEFESTIAGGID
nr:maleylpyruvate isomerase N-terminal domain-containing protein [Propionibacteriales bacterium]